MIKADDMIYRSLKRILWIYIQYKNNFNSFSELRFKIYTQDLTFQINKNLENIGKKLGGPDKFNKDAAKKAMDAMLSPEDEDLFEDITEEELIEFAGEMSISSEL